MEGANPCARCVMITIDQLTGEKNQSEEPRRTLQTYRKFGDRGEIFFRRNFVPITTDSSIRLDDTVSIISVL